MRTDMTVINGIYVQRMCVTETDITQKNRFIFLTIQWRSSCIVIHCGVSKERPVNKQRGFVCDSVNFIGETVEKHRIALVEKWNQLYVVLARSE